jgi:hypothetical protein
VTDFDRLLQALIKHEVEFVIVGGYAATLHGSAQLTLDLDICYERSRENYRRLVKALSPYKPHPRDFPANLPFVFDDQTIASGTNFTFRTTLGDIDLLGEMSGVGQYDQAVVGARTIPMHGRFCKIASLEVIIRSKKAAGRPKDLLTLPELEAMREVNGVEEKKESES